MVSPTEPKSGSQISVPKKKPITHSISDAAPYNAPATPDVAVALIVSPAPTGVEASSASDDNEVPSTASASNPLDRDPSEGSGLLPVSSSTVDVPKLGGVPVCHGSDGNTYIRVADTKNASVLRVGTKPADHFIRRLAHQKGTRLKTNELREVNDDLIAYAELSGQTCDVWHRVAPFEDGIELDVGDDQHTRIRVTPGKVEIITEGSETLFYRPPTMRAFAC